MRGRKPSTRQANCSRFSLPGHLSVLSACAALAVLAAVVAASAEPQFGCSTASHEIVETTDRWSRHIREAAERFHLPERLLRAVIHAESVGDALAISPKGAMGLMQIMPVTWQELRTSLALGDDPFDPRENIVAGAAYLRQMLDRFGPDGFLAAYNAGPRRYEERLVDGRPLPAATIGYVDRLAPLIGQMKLDTPLRGKPADGMGAARAPIFPRPGGSSSARPKPDERSPGVAGAPLIAGARLHDAPSPPTTGITDLTAFEPLADLPSANAGEVPPDSLFVRRSTPPAR